MFCLIIDGDLPIRADDVDFAIIWGCVLAFDTAVFSLTVKKVLEIRRAWCRSLLTVMLRDGKLDHTDSIEST